MHIYITIFPKQNPENKIKLSDIQKDYRSNCIEVGSLNQTHVLKFLATMENNKVYELGNLNMVLLESPTEVECVRSVKAQQQNQEDSELEDFQKYMVVKKYKYQHRIEVQEFNSTIYLEKNIGYDNLVKLEEMVENNLEKRVTEDRKIEIVKNLNQTGYCYKLSTDIDEKYKYLNPIYVLAYTLSKYVDGTIQIDDHHHDNWKCGIYENDEFELQMKNKIRTITHD